MLQLPSLVLIAFDCAIILAAALLISMFCQRRKGSGNSGYKTALGAILAGIVGIVLAVALHLYGLIAPILPASWDVFAQGIKRFSLVPFSSGALLIFYGLLLLVYRVLPKSERQFNELVGIQEQLAASNDALTQTLAARNQELEIHNMTLQQVLADQQTSRGALLQSEKKFRTLFDESPALFTTVNALHTITDINLYGAKCLGYDTASLVGQPLASIVSLEDSHKQQDFIDSCFEHPKQTRETELRFLRNDMEKIWVRVSCSVIKQEDNENCLLLVCQDITDSKKLAETLSYQAKHDDLTGLYNRRALEKFLEEKLAVQSANGKPLALIYIDVDQLKVVNDTCGHIAGDEYIRQLVLIINRHQRQFDFFARIGGDEFAVICCETSKREIQEFAEVIRNAAEDYMFRWEEQSFRQSISIGIALSSPKINTLRDIFSAADTACFTAKQAGRNRVVLHEEKPGRFSINHNEMLWVSRLQTALMRDRFELYFQPIFPLHNNYNGYVHYEVLLRYVDDDGTHISPDQFLPAAEKYGLATQIDLWVLTTTLDFLQHNLQHTAMLDCCSINLSGRSLESHQSRMAILQLIMTADIQPYKICFEITETSAIHNISEAMTFINELKVHGCRFALDDFGTGFSSFNYLKNLDVDYIKIDGSFVRDIISDPLSRAMVKAMNSIGQELGVITIAEYVENEQVHQALKDLDIAYGQGYSLAKPMPIEKAKEYYALTQRVNIAPSTPASQK